MSSPQIASLGLDPVDSHPDSSLIAAIAATRIDSAPPSSSVISINPNDKIQFYRILDNITGSNDVMTSIRCLETLEKIIGNILKNPEEEKYSKVKVKNGVFRNNVIKAGGGGRDFLLKTGFRGVVKDFEEYLTVNSPLNTLQLQIFNTAHSCLVLKLDLLKSSLPSTPTRTKEEEEKEIREEVMKQFRHDRVMQQKRDARDREKRVKKEEEEEGN